MGKILTIAIFLILVIGSYFFWAKGSFSLFKKPLSKGLMAIKEKGALIVGTDATYPPLEYEEDGKIIGFDIDLATEIAKDLGVPLEIKNISFDKIFTSLANSDVDLVISSVTITEERQKKMIFSTPYLNAGQVIVVSSSNKTIQSVDDLNNLSVGVQVDTTSKTEAEKYTNKVTDYPDYDKAQSDLNSGKISAIVIDYPAGISMTQASSGKLKVVGNPFTSEFYGVAINKGKIDLALRVNDTINKIKKSGRLNDLEVFWFKR
ncbi:MAG: Glutamine ABC transporter, periplasmic glutamine-binding protein [Candidatus Roizmanbacteria bacterium GW2011_GWA2_35_19]|uniref:Glutamine ABC transporter, periplasmic glutamine-binding protein n=2 Tax=Candidatus Roizmaniibacteriota TaxID=1752723 RepID=A0A0G0BS08_9BACT|nr:MAG: Glutamine ABC transporter, periplasmic glutamine-binding protein [Candidatus Roizmanbacteria bacterium GW2011_GWC2_35_12]KKP72158.1 MAG: Glutamine ABC transporter, periplasmic glutamine-binding protein [Candidatus Roizmanbacteria bacterium GW2011_GWA2_35_19]